VIPDADVILAAARDALGKDANVSEKAIRAAVFDARRLAGPWQANEPAAIFFAFACRPRAFPRHPKMVSFLALEQAQSLHITINASEGELQALRGRVMRREVDYDVVLQWFAERTPVE
jgi:hypothetical protein